MTEEPNRGLSNPMTQIPTVVIIGVNEMALAAARNLHGHGVEVLAIHPGGGPPSAFSLSRTFATRLGPSLDDEEAFGIFLEGLPDELGGRPVLLPAQDQALLFLHAYRARLRQYFDFFVWDSDLLQAIGSKAGLAEVAREHQLPVPRSFAPRNPDELQQAADELRYPCIIKPEFTNDWWTEAAHAEDLNRKAIEAVDRATLMNVCQRSARVGARVVIQEKIVGPDSSHLSYMTFIDRSGDPVGEVIVEKHRVSPPRFGVACYAEATLAQDAIDLGREVLSRIGFRGLASVQFKRDARDGKLYLIEINLRLPLAVGLPISAGVELPYIYYQVARGDRPVQGPVRVGARWMAFGRDIRSMRVYAREGTYSWVAWLIELLRMPAFTVFSVRDPLPTLAMAWDVARSALLRRWRALRGARLDNPKVRRSHEANKA